MFTDALEQAAQDPVMNKNINDPNSKIIVRLVATGKLVAIDRWKDFKPGYHEEFKPGQAAEAGVSVNPLADPLDEIANDGPEVPAALQPQPEAVGAPTHEGIRQPLSLAKEENVDEKLFAALQLKGYVNLEGDERKVYSELKKKLQK